MIEQNCMGLDKFQLAVIKGNYTSLKPIITKRNKLMAKVEAATKKEEDAILALKQKTQETLKNIYKEISVYDEQITALDNITKGHTQRACGMELTSEQVMNFLANSQAFEDYKKSLGIGDDLFQQEPYHENVERDLDAEEDKEWEDRIASGELKEAV